MNNNFDLKQFLAEGTLLKEDFQNKNILIINDGTDEIFNMHGIEASNEEDFRNQFEDMFGESPEEYGTAGSYLSIPTQEQLNKIVTISDANMHEDEDIEYLELLNNKAVSWNEIKNIFN
jgi:hypothetical protein